MTPVVDVDEGAPYGAAVPDDQPVTRSVEAFTTSEKLYALYLAALDVRDDAVRADHADGAKDRTIAEAVCAAVGDPATVSVSNVRAIRNRGTFRRPGAATPDELADAIKALGL